MKFEAGNGTREKKKRLILVLNKSEERSEKSGSLFISLFSREREIESV